MKNAILAATLALLVLAAGCGGEGQSPEEAWADELCSAAAEWRASLDGVAGELRSTPSLSPETVRAAVADALTATETLAADLRTLRPPAGEAGEEAATVADALATDIEALVADVRARFDSAESLQELVAGLTDAIEEIAGLGETLGNALEGLRGLEGGPALLDAVEANEDCRVTPGS